MLDQSLPVGGDESSRLPKYITFNRELFASNDEYDLAPEHLKLMPLGEFLDYLKPGEDFSPGVYVLFGVDGYDPSELYMRIYVRSGYQLEEYFPLIRIELAGPMVEDAWLREIKEASISNDGRRSPKGHMYGKGAFRSLISYLERELPPRGFKGIYLEKVINPTLASVALRYGFEPVREPEASCFIKSFAHQG